MNNNSSMSDFPQSPRGWHFKRVTKMRPHSGKAPRGSASLPVKKFKLHQNEKWDGKCPAKKTLICFPSRGKTYLSYIESN
jgi:hypothetical protein